MSWGGRGRRVSWIGIWLIGLCGIGRRGEGAGAHHYLRCAEHAEFADVKSAGKRGVVRGDLHEGILRYNPGVCDSQPSKNRTS